MKHNISNCNRKINLSSSNLKSTKLMYIKYHISNTMIPYLISIYYRVKSVKNTVYNIKVVTTGESFKLKLRITGVSRFPIINTLLLRRLGRYEPETSLILKKELSAGDKVLELGAAEGYFSVEMSRYVGDSGEIHSFEPSKIVYNDLKYNLKINECINVTPYCQGLSGQKSSLVGADNEGFETRDIVEFFSEMNFNFNFIFIDIDALDKSGNEARQEELLLMKIKDIIKEKKPKIFLEYIERDASLCRIFDMLYEIGYEAELVTKRHFLFKYYNKGK